MAPTDQLNEYSTTDSPLGIEILVESKPCRKTGGGDEPCGELLRQSYPCRTATFGLWLVA
jgi:hypothetical protein